VAVGVLFCDLAVFQLFDDLGVAGKIVSVDEIVCGYTASGLSNPISVAVIKNGNAVAGCGQLVLEIVVVGLAV